MATENAQPETRPYRKGDRCLMRRSKVDGQPIAIHYDCNDWADGVKTSIMTGKRIHDTARDVH